MNADLVLPPGVPAMAVCGWSGSGKTRLLEKLIAVFTDQGYWVGVVKHDAHTLEIDRPGKNTYQLWQAGAHSLLAHDAGQIFLRLKKSPQPGNTSPYLKIAVQNDFLLIEGHKNTPLPKIWLEHPEKPGLPDDVTHVAAVLPWGENRVDEAIRIISGEVRRQWRAIPLYAGILIGGKSRRMGFPKQDLKIEGRLVLDHLIQTAASIAQEAVLLGKTTETESSSARSLRSLPDCPECEGPLAAVVSAFRWQPNAAWLFLACDLVNVRPEALQWLIDQRELGTRAVVPKDERYVHPLFAVYEPGCAVLFEQMLLSKQASLRGITQQEKIKTVWIPKPYESNWMNCNTPEELEGWHQDSRASRF